MKPPRQAEALAIAKCHEQYTKRYLEAAADSAVMGLLGSDSTL